MALSISEKALELWDAWNIRGSIILSMSLQAFLILLAPLRRGRIGGSSLIFSIWLAYLAADWVAIHTIGLIFSSNGSSLDGTPKDITAFWASFLLLHLGGPDSITSFSVEDNELWKRHLFTLVLQVGYTIYTFLNSFSTNHLWLPTILVLFAGIVKYLERNVAFYLASFDHFGKNWDPVSEPTAAADEETVTAGPRHGISLPQQFSGMGTGKSIVGIAVKLFGNLKRTLVGPLLDKKEQEEITRIFSKIKSSAEGLQVIEIELSLLYEALHTKLPVITTTAGCFFRMANLGCILVALLSFSLVKKQYQLAEADLFLTYGLLIGALMLEVLSLIVLYKFSDWVAIFLFKYKSHSPDCYKLFNKIIKRRRWSKTVPQLNFFKYHVTDPVWLQKLYSLPYIGSLLEILHGSLCLKSQNFQPFHWRYILWTLWDLADKASKNQKAQEGKQLSLLNDVWLSRSDTFGEFLQVWASDDERRKVENIISSKDYTKLLLHFHIATELSYEMDDTEPRNGRTDYRSICKLLSDYMFYLAMMQPTMMASVLDNWKDEFDKTSAEAQSLVPWSLFLGEKIARKKIFDKRKDQVLLGEAVLVAKGIIKWKGPYFLNWKRMSKVWLELMMYAAINCKPSVHAEQPSKGGELLTFVWCLMNHLGLGTKLYQTLEEKFQEEQSDGED